MYTWVGVRYDNEGQHERSVTARQHPGTLRDERWSTYVGVDERDPMRSKVERLANVERELKQVSANQDRVLGSMTCRPDSEKIESQRTG